MTIRRCLLPLALLLSAVSAEAQGAPPPPQGEMFLVPIHLVGPTPGALNSVWESELTVLNAGATAAFVQNIGYYTGVGFVAVPFTPGAAVRQPVIAGLLGGPGIPGAILRVSPQYVDDFEFQLRVRDTSRAGHGYGTWIPVVHESEVGPTPVHLMNVPTDERYRLLLRVYSLNAVARPVRVRVYGSAAAGTTLPSPPDPLLDEISVVLRTGASRPAYAEIRGDTLLARAEGMDRVRIVVESDGEIGVWAMVSITNNVTQEVTMVLPGRR